MCQSCILMRFQTIVIVLSLYLVFELLCSLLLISLMSALLRICFCQFAQSASLFVSRSAIAPKVKVHSWAKRERVISKSNVPSSAFCYFLSIVQSWGYRSVKLFNRSFLLSEHWCWEVWRSLRQRAKRNEHTGKIKCGGIHSWVI